MKPNPKLEERAFQIFLIEMNEWGAEAPDALIDAAAKNSLKAAHIFEEVARKFQPAEIRIPDVKLTEWFRKSMPLLLPKDQHLLKDSKATTLVYTGNKSSLLFHLQKLFDKETQYLVVIGAGFPLDNSNDLWIDYSIVDKPKEAREAEGN